MFQLMIFIKLLFAYVAREMLPELLRLRSSTVLPCTAYRSQLGIGLKPCLPRNVSGGTRPPQTAICDECATGIASIALTHIVTNPRALYVSSPLSLEPGNHGIKCPLVCVAPRQPRAEGHCFPRWSFGESLDWLLQHIHRAGIHGGGPVPLPLYRTRQPQGLPLGDAWST